ncbi:MAG: alpha-2-macroglobulin family protein [Sedimentitalea sp.]
MTRAGLTTLVWVWAVFMASLGAIAQQTVPDFRYVMTRDMDFYGADLDALFDTDLQSCVRACTATQACQAFTFNSRSNACFPKRGVTEQTPYTGAISAQKQATDARVLANANGLSANLGFLSDRDLTTARVLGRDIGLRHAAGGLELDALITAARARANAGSVGQAVGWMGAAVSLSDRSDLWTSYARLLLRLKPETSRARRDVRTRAISSAVNGYLRGASPGARASALGVLAQALEKAGRGRDVIPALRLANQEQQRDDIILALEKAVAKYGFRITDTTVESDSAAPRICAEFSEPLVKVGVDYEPFVRVGENGLAVQADGRKLCLDGVRHGERYRVTFRSGLPAASGETLFKDVDITLYVRDRSASVRFPGRAYVLPKSTTTALPIETVNLSKVNLRLRRLSDRNLLRAVQDGYFGKPLSQWQDETFAREIAQEVWTGTGEVQNELNRDMTTRLPLGEAIAGQPAGIYALSARLPGVDLYENAGATQWFVLSDLGLSTMSGTDGLHVTVRGLSDALPRAGVDVTLVSRTNAVLGKAVTNDDGHVRFDPGLTRGQDGAAPALVLAQLGEADLGFLSLTDPAFDLSDRGVEGRPPAGPVDVFLTTDRGAYRAGETIHATVLSRDGEARAIDGLPLLAILSRPDGVQYRSVVSDGGNAGGHVFALPVGQTAPRGAWRLDIKSDPKAEALASQTLLIEDFLPERIDFDLTLPDAPLRLGTTPALRVDARYLFGAPGADLNIEGEVQLRAARDVQSWPGYRFGRYDAQGTARSAYFSGQTTDAQGQAIVQLDLPTPDVPGLPLELRVTARLADGAARPVERRISAPVQPNAPVIGIKTLFEDVVAEGSEATFQIIGLGPDLQPTKMPVRWTLNRLQTRYQWYQQYGNWNWEPITRRTRVATGETTLGAVPLDLSQPVEWGRYELVVERVGGTYSAAAIDFYAGWYAPVDASSSPDRLELSLDRASYAPGDTANLRIVPRAAGTALITVMSNRVIERRAVDVPAGASVIPLTVAPEWGTGAYVSATVIRAMDAASGQTPTRAIGLAHAKVEPVGKVLSVSIDAPEVGEPRQSQTIGLEVTGAATGSEVWLTLAAVDLGILNLTGFDSPDPEGHYFGQRRLGVELRDVYGRLIDATNGAMGTVRSGGDNDAGLRMQSPPPTQDLMAVFSGPVRVGLDGRTSVTVDLPAFNGTVRLMAVAWTNAAVGQQTRDMIVRDPVVVTASAPRFLAPGDASVIRLDVQHAGGPAGEMSLALRRNGDGLDLGTAPGRFVLGVGGKASFEVPVLAQRVGDPTIDVALVTPDGRELVQTLRLPVRANDPEIAQTRRFELAAGNSFRFSTDVFTGLRPGTGRAILSSGPLAKFDAPGLLNVLDRYPYGCTEQVTSQAMPLLYLSSVAQASGLGSGPAVQARIDDAIARVLTRQASNGGFGLWRAESGEFWLDAYASDFLSRARAEGYVVPDIAFRLAMDNLRNRVNYAPDFDKGGQDIAYALLVLAREGAASMGDLRYYADIKADAFATPLAVAQVGAALAAYGDQTRADAMFARAGQMLTPSGSQAPVWRADFGTSLRDAAGVLALASESGSQALNLTQLGDRVAQGNQRRSTQEAAWTLMAAQALIKSPEQSGLRVDGAPVSGPFVHVMDDGRDTTALTLTSADGRQTDITLTTLGVPLVAPEAGGTGYSIKRRYFSMDGVPLDQGSLARSQRFVTLLEISAFEDSGARLMINDPLPAGVEIDNPSLLRSGDVKALDWLQSSSATHVEFRSDRFLAAVDLRATSQVTLAYIARAVTPGSFHHPAASVEDMYRPRFRARTATGRIVVTP